MVSLFDLAQDASGEEASPIQELRLNGEPAAVLLFTNESQPVRLHFEKDPAFNAYVVCPGNGCPLCFLGNAPKEFALLPVLNIESGEVEVLRTSLRRGPGCLLEGLLPVLKRTDLADIVVLISRNGARYSVTTQPLASNASRHEKAIATFLEGLQQGLKLQTAFCAPTAAELADAERIRRKLDAMGGYEPLDPEA